MLHFEDIWNAAEHLGEQLQSEQNISEDIKTARQSLDKLESVATLEEQNELMAEILFSLCQITRKVPMNSAALLNRAIENKRAQLLDPDEDDV